MPGKKFPKEYCEENVKYTHTVTAETVPGELDEEAGNSRWEKLCQNK